MGEKVDKAKGRTKEALGDLTDDERLKREGKIDQASGAVKGAADRAADKVQEGTEKVRRELDDDDDR
jgi:uncharacterized protein YjbJ (UPF0337 family)